MSHSLALYINRNWLENLIFKLVTYSWLTQMVSSVQMHTDVYFTYQLAGIITPNDGKCHLDPHGLYTESTTQVSIASYIHPHISL